LICGVMNTASMRRRQYVRYIGAEAVKTEKQDRGNSVIILQSLFLLIIILIVS